MGYVVYHISSKRRVGWNETIRGAKISKAAWNRRSGAANYDIIDEEVFHDLYNRLTPVKNMMSGKTVWIREQDKGGCCDPSTETYWSM